MTRIVRWGQRECWEAGNASSFRVVHEKTDPIDFQSETDRTPLNFADRVSDTR